MADLISIAPSAAYLVDLFLSGDIDGEIDAEDAEFTAEGCVEDETRHDGDPEDVAEMNKHFLRTKVGQDLKSIGDDINKKYERATHKSLSDKVKQLFNEQVKKAGGDPETFWPKYRDLMDSAAKDTGLDDANKVLAAVLVSVKGLHYLGSSVRIFTLRYIRERKLDEDFKKLEQNTESRAHPLLD